MHYGENPMDQMKTLKFFKQLKETGSVKLGVTTGAVVDYQFLGDVEKCAQQINHNRNIKGRSSLLKVEITDWQDMD